MTTGPTRRILTHMKTRKDPFRFRPVTVKGKGLAIEAQDGGWATIGQAIYRGRGA
jgi:hypothetical protein